MGHEEEIVSSIYDNSLHTLCMPHKLFCCRLLPFIYLELVPLWRRLGYLKMVLVSAPMTLYEQGIQLF